MVNANNLDLQKEQIFVDPRTNGIKCVFWPIVNNQRENPPHLFLKRLPYEIKFNPYEGDYLVTYKAFFDGINPFSTNAFERMISELSGAKNTEEQTTVSAALSGRTGSGKKERMVYDFSKNRRIEYDPLATVPYSANGAVKGSEDAIFCTACGTKNRPVANFCNRCGKPLPKKKPEEVIIPKVVPPVEPETTLLEDLAPETTVLNAVEVKKPVYPTLIRRKTGEVFVVALPCFRIGKTAGCCDLIICDNTYISRNHADIVSHDNKYYIIDRNSTNKTYVDDRAIPPGKEVEICAKTRIRLADEEFDFNIES